MLFGLVEEAFFAISLCFYDIINVTVTNNKLGMILLFAIKISTQKRSKGIIFEVKTNVAKSIMALGKELNIPRN